MAESPIPIAIIGMACRFPGGANSPQKLWDLLASGSEPWSDVPSDRFNWKAFHHPDPDAIEANNHRGGHFLSQDPAAFDAKFFGIPPQEAIAIDPQHRIQLEVAYEALENAGIILESIKGSDTGVYVAIFNTDYQTMIMKDTLDVPKYQAIGTGPAIASNRISYTFDLRGPSFTLDTGCSGSLVALHQACQSLMLGESHMTLVGGSNIILNPDTMDAMSNLHMLNPDGKSYSFDHRGSGYGRGEGAGMVVLKRLTDALDSGDPIRAIIRNTGVNQDGKTNGITLPNQESQKDLIQAVYACAGLRPQETGYIEAHGTGTVVGDARELGAIADVFGRNGERQGNDSTAPIAVGSIKANIGHTESAAGVAALIKAVLVLEKGSIPPNMNLERLKDGLDLENSNIRIPLKLEDLPRPRVSVNSFGYGGTNAHAILDAASKYQSLHPLENGKMNGHGSFFDRNQRNARSPADLVCVGEDEDKLRSPILGPAEPERRSYLFVLSAQAEASLSAAVKSLYDLASHNVISNDQLEDLAYTLNSRRNTFTWRSSVVASRSEDFRGSQPQNPLHRKTRAFTNLRTMFVFTGQGAQWYAMGRELLVTYPIFETSIRDGDFVLRKLGANWSLLEELTRNEDQSRLRQSQFGQPACTAIQIALVTLLRSFGVIPDAVLGHSSGEIAAAYACGALSLEMAMLVSYRRGLLPVQRNGAMVSVALGEGEAEKVVCKLKFGTACVACVNSPSSTTISGDEAAIEELERLLDAAGISNKRLKVDTAFHSQHMQLVAEEYNCSLRDLQSDTPRNSTAFFSSVTGQRKLSGLTNAYWTENLVSKVRFSEALQRMCEAQRMTSSQGDVSSMHVLIECGPHNTLSSFSKQTIAHAFGDSFPFQYLSCLSRGKNAVTTILELAGNLFEQGHSLDLSTVNSICGPRTPVTCIEPYSWDHSQGYWHESRLSKQHRFRRHGYHELLGLRKVNGISQEPGWRNILKLAYLPWLQDHAIDGLTIFPGSAYLCMAIEALRQMNEIRGAPEIPGKYLFRDVLFKRALSIPDSPGGVEVQLTLRVADDSSDCSEKKWERFSVFSGPQDEIWHENCRGFVVFESSTESELEIKPEDDVAEMSELPPLEELRRTCTQVVDVGALYDELRRNGNHYGPSFTKLKQLSIGKSLSSGSINVSSTSDCTSSVDQESYLIHPTTLDALLHASIPLYMQQCQPSSVMTLGIPELSISTSAAETPYSKLLVASKLIAESPNHAKGDIAAFKPDAESAPKLVVHFVNSEFRGRGKKPSPEDKGSGHRLIQWEMKWQPDVGFIPTEMFSPNPVIDGGEMSAEQKLEALDRLATMYIHRLFRNSPEMSLIANKTHRALLLQWMQQHIKSDLSQKLIQAPDSEFEDLRSKVRKTGPEGEMLYRIGENLSLILVEGADPLPIMLEDNLLYRLYADDASTRCYEHLIKYFHLLSFKHRPLKILEIGAGTGGTTLPLLQSVSNDDSLIERYDFTDISLGFFDRARALLAEWSRILQYRTLDISKDPIGQGFGDGEYDVVIATNVLHTTLCIDDTLANVRRLLKPSGTLLLIEVTRTTPFYNTCFGCLPGWWAGVNDGRTDSPLLSQNQWDDALKRSAFTGVEIAAYDFDGPAQRSTLMVTKAASSNDVPSYPSLVMVVDATGSMWKIATDTVQQLSDTGSRCMFQEWPASDLSRDAVYVILDSGDKPLLADLSLILFEKVKSLVTRATKILWVTLPRVIRTTENPEKGLITGLARTARVEDQALKFVTLEIQDGQANIPDLIAKLVSTSFSGNPTLRSKELEYQYKAGQLLILRLISSEKVDLSQIEVKEPHSELFRQPDRPLRLLVEGPRLGKDLHFCEYEDLRTRTIQPFEIEIEVVARGIDSDQVTSLLTQNISSNYEAAECAGFVSRVGSHLQSDFHVGDRVCAWGNMPLSSYVRVDGSSVCRVPAFMSFGEAATMPIATLTAHYSLIELANLQKGQTLLIHVTDSSVAEAAIRVANDIEADVILIADDALKKHHLVEEHYITENRILCNRPRLFKVQIQELTAGKGVDVALTSFSGKLIKNLSNCISTLGTIIALGRQVNFEFPKPMIARNIRLASLDFDVLCQHRSEVLGRIMAKLMPKFESKEWVSMSASRVLPISDIETAFQWAQSSNPPTRIVLESEASSEVTVLGRKTPAAAQLRSNATYVVAGGLGSIGMRACKVLARRGARHLAILSRRVVNDEDLRKVQAQFRRFDVQVRVISCDITDVSSLRKVISDHLSGTPPVHGVVHSAMVLKPALLQNMTFQNFQAALKPKLQGTYALAEVFGHESLDFFVLLSSSGNIIGNKGQANYAAGSTFQDAFAATQVGLGPNVLALDLGWWENTPIVTKSSVTGQAMFREGFLPLSNVEIDALLEYSISSQAREDRCRQHIVGFNRESLSNSENNQVLRNPMFSSLPYASSHETRVATGESKSVPTRSIEELLSSTRNMDEAQQIIGEHILRKVTGLLSLRDNQIGLQSSIADSGMDSFVTIELQIWISNSFKASVQVNEVGDASSILALARVVAERSEFVRREVGA